MCVCICMYVCMYVCMYKCACVFVYVHVYIIQPKVGLIFSPKFAIQVFKHFVPNFTLVFNLVDPL